MTSPRPRSVVLVDDHQMVLAGLQRLVDSHEGFQVVATCHDGRSGLEAIRSARPDLAVVDMNMPGIDGLEVLSTLKAELQTRFVLLAASVTDRQIFDAVTYGAWGLVLKEWAAETLLDCLTEVADGRRHLPERIVGPALERELKRREAGHRLLQELSGRELEIVRLVDRSLHSKAIASQLNISDGTLKIHLNHIYRKLRVTSRADLALLIATHRDQLD